jgi:hypothetical protein
MSIRSDAPMRAMRSLAFIALVACSNDEKRAAVDHASDPQGASDAAPSDADLPNAQDARVGTIVDARTPEPQHDAGLLLHDAAIAQDAATPPDLGPPFPSVTDFGMPGPFEVLHESSPADCAIDRPKLLGEGGRLHPVIIWGNGTGAPSPAVYAGFFRQWASHGFIVAEANTPNAGTGKEMLACLDWVESEHMRAGSPYQGHVALGRAGASGHSQGGGGAIMVGRDGRIIVTVPIMAYTQGLGHDKSSESEQHGPMFLVSGSSDTIAPPEQNQHPAFEASNVPTFWGTLQGGDHVTIALGVVAKYLAPTTAWFRLHLMGDESARAMFYSANCGLCSNADWVVQRKGID